MEDADGLSFNFKGGLRKWLRCLCVKYRDDEKDRSCSSSSKIDLIPLDLEIEILSRLPAKSLMKFQCVSKIWSSIIRSNSFVDSFFSMSSMTQSRFLITFGSGAFAKDGDRRLFIFSSSYEREESSSLPTNLEMTIPMATFYSTGAYCISVHGLIWCCHNGPFIVCNPSTKKVSTLLAPRTTLGYDPVGHLFKALTLVSRPSYRNHDSLVHEVSTLGGGESSWTRSKVTTPPYLAITKSVCINGFVYTGAWSPRPRVDPVILCFDVRFERISFIKAPMPVVCWESQSILIGYKGKLAAIARYPYANFHSFDLFILEDVKTHDWSKQTFELPFSLGMAKNITSPGTNKAGEIIFAPKTLSYDIQPFYIFFYNVDRKDIRRVRLLGIADDQEFRSRHGFAEEFAVSILPEHVESIASF